MGRECQEIHIALARTETVGPAGIAGLGIEMLQPATSRTHMDEAVVVIGNVAHQARRRADDTPEILLKAALRDPVGSLYGEVVAMPLMLEASRVMIPQQERRVIEPVEVRRQETPASLLERQEPA